MKTTLTSLLILAITSFAFAQNPDKALARVSYSFTHIQDTTQKDKPYTENMLLVIGKNASVYTSYDKINRDLEIQKQLIEQLKNQAGSGSATLKVGGTSSKKVSDVDYFYFAKENKFFVKERVFNNYLIEDFDGKIDWKITKDTTSFSGVHCQKAMARFKGRNWIVWFAPDLPFQSGPWKLNGLPGLIVEAYDEKREVQFQFAGLENITENKSETNTSNQTNLAMPSNGVGTVKIMGADNGSTYLGNEIKLPKDAIKTTRKELDKLKEARDKDPQGFMQAQMAASGINIKIGASATIKTATQNETVLNNPIELPEKK